MEEEKLNKINEIIDYQAKILVGILLKRIEVLQEEHVLTPELYKKIVKEHIYEQFRFLKKLIEVFVKVGRIEFKNRE